MILSIIVPVYNEEKTIIKILEKIKNNPSSIFKHEIGKKSSEDQLIFEEKDDTFSCYVSKSKSRKYIVIGSYQTLSSEYNG